MDKARTAKLGLMQVSKRYDWSVETCITEMLYLAEECLKAGADLVFMPEGNQYKALANHSPRDMALKYADGYKEQCSQLANKYHAYVVPWDYEAASEGKVYNTSYILNRQGLEIGRFRKVHLPFGELFAGITSGQDFPVFELDFAKVGIMICFDNYYPESAEILALNGAEVILYPLYGDTLPEQWEIRVKARAIDNTIYIAPCHIHSAHELEEASYTGLVDPEGKVVRKLSAEGSWQVIPFEPGRQVWTCTSASPGVMDDIRQYLRKCRSPQAYGPLLKHNDVPEWEDIIKDNR